MPLPKPTEGTPHVAQRTLKRYSKSRVHYSPDSRVAKGAHDGEDVHDCVALAGRSARGRGQAPQDAPERATAAESRYVECHSRLCEEVRGGMDGTGVNGRADAEVGAAAATSLPVLLSSSIRAAAFNAPTRFIA
jgi:hypothetical protein